ERDGRARALAALAETKGELDGRGAQVATLERELGSLKRRVSELETPPNATPDETHEAEPAFHIRLVSQSSGHALSEGAGPPPRAGELVGVNGGRFWVARVGPSPLPNDARTCAFLISDSEPSAPSPSPSEVSPSAGVNTAGAHADKHESHAAGDE